MNTILIVDDERLFTRSLAEGLAGPDGSFDVLVANDGREAVGILETRPVDLVVTDIQMPVMDGFELLACMSQRFPDIPVLVVTAFGTDEIAGRLRTLGVDRYVEKPIDLEALARRITEVLASGASGRVRGITLPTSLQIIELERKTCSLTVSSEGREGRLYFKAGELLDAEADGLSGHPAALRVLSWPGAAIEIANGCRREKPRIAAKLEELLLEAMRLHDEGGVPEGQVPTGIEPGSEAGAAVAPSEEPDLKKGRIMNAQEKLKELSGLEGFAGVALYTPAGENLAIVTAGNGFKPEVGVLANNVLINAQKSSLEMGAGRGQQVHIEAEKAHILARCLNEGTDPIRSQPGKAHIHMVLVLTSDASIGMAKMRMNSVIEKLAEEFRL